MGKVRTRLTSADFGQVRLMPEPSPVLETLASTVLLRESTSNPFLQRWRVRAAKGLGPAGAQIMHVMNSPLVVTSDLLVRHALASENFDAAVDSMKSTPQGILSRDMGQLLRRGFDEPTVNDLDNGSRNTIAGIATNLQRYYQGIVCPSWHMSLRQGHIGFLEQRRRMTEYGVDWLLRNLHPALTWDPPFLTLELICHVDHRRWPQCPLHELDKIQEMSVDGRGLVLVPSLFAREPLIYVDDFDDRPAMIFYPVMADWSAFENERLRRAVELAPVLGRARATILEALAIKPRTTSNLARAVNLSVASASEHTAVLRRAGLVLSVRDGMSVIHSLTDTGAVLFCGRV